MNTIVFTRLIRWASRAATRCEPADRTPVQKKTVPAARGQATDDTIKSAGRVGMWTKADSVQVQAL